MRNVKIYAYLTPYKNVLDKVLVFFFLNLSIYLINHLTPKWLQETLDPMAISLIAELEHSIQLVFKISVEDYIFSFNSMN